MSLTLDPGSHEIVVVSPIRARRTIVFQLREGERREETILEGPPIASASLRLPVGRDPSAYPAKSASPLRTIGWASLGTSAALVGAASVLGLLAMDRNGVVEDRCHGTYCDSLGLSAANEGRSFATGSTIGFAAGGVLILAGAALLIFGPH